MHNQGLIYSPYDRDPMFFGYQFFSPTDVVTSSLKLVHFTLGRG